LKSNLKKQVADLQSSVQELTKRVGSLQGKFDSYLVPRLQKMDRELVELQTANTFLTGIQNAVMKLEDWRDRQRTINEKFVDQFREFVSNLTGVVTPEEAMTLYNEMMSKFLKVASNELKPETVVEPEDDSID